MVAFPEFPPLNVAVLREQNQGDVGRGFGCGGNYRRSL